LVLFSVLYSIESCPYLFFALRLIAPSAFVVFVFLCLSLLLLLLLLLLLWLLLLLAGLVSLRACVLYLL